jgi:small subunit ribosomal protein S9
MQLNWQFQAICNIDNDYKEILGQNMLLRRDSRIKERRKYGLKKARKASQYSKR